MKIVGCLSGTSVDGIDVCVCEITDTPLTTSPTSKCYDYLYDIKLLCYDTVDWNVEDKKQVFSLMNSKQLSARDFCISNFMIGDRFAKAILQVLKKHNIKEVDVIGSHGQTIWHEVMDNGTVHSTYQLGESSMIAQQCGVPVVSDFRVNDVACGGQGAPLTSIFDYLILRRRDGKWRAVQNIGGMGNVTFVPPFSKDDNNSKKVISFDTGPGNALIDEAVRLASNGAKNYDNDGEMAVKGKVNDTLLSKIMSMDYFSMKPPKTTGRELFGTEMAKKWFEFGKNELGMSNEDIVSTFTEITVKSIVDAYQKFGPKELADVVIGGGGRENKEMMKRLEKQLQAVYGPQLKVVGHEDLEEMNNHSQSSEAKEAMLFALLAYLFMKKRTGNLPSVTGAKKEVVLGKLSLP